MNAALGTIAIWGGVLTDIPPGWSLCDGQNGTPDLRDRFVIGTGNKYNIGDIGGSEEVTLTIDQMPSHNHMFSMYMKDTDRSRSSSGSDVVPKAEFKTYDSLHAGGSQPHPNMPPYYALCYIMKTSYDPITDGATILMVREEIQKSITSAMEKTYYGT